MEDFDKICRTCLEEITDYKYLFNMHCINEEKLRLSEILTACTSIEVLENDNLPKQVCVKCENNILNTFSFQQLCHKSDSILKTILSQPVQPQVLELKPVENIEEANNILNYYTAKQDQLNHLVNKVENFKRYLNESIKEKSLNEDSGCLVNTGSYLGSDNVKFSEQASWHTESANSQHIELTSSSTSSKYTFKLVQVNSLDDAVNDQLTSVKILKEEIDDHEKNDGDQEHSSYSFNEKNQENETTHKELHSYIGDETLEPLSSLKYENDSSSSYHSESVDSHFMHQKLSSISSKHTFKQGQVNHLNEAIYGQISSVKILKEDSDDDKMDFRNQGNVESISYSFNKNYESGSTNYHAGAQQIDSNDLSTEVEDETLQPLFACEAEGCVQVFTTLEDSKEHSKMHLPMKNYCKICNKTFFKASNLSRHMSTKHDPEKEIHSCSVCGKGFSRSCPIKKHIQNDPEGPFSCEICGKTFALSCSLFGHMRSHPNARNYVCTVCDIPFAGFSYLLAHVKKHNAESHKSPQRDKRANSIGPAGLPSRVTDKLRALSDIKVKKTLMPVPPLVWLHN